MAVRLTSSSQVKRYPDRFSFKPANTLRLAGCKPRTVWMMVQRFPAKIPHNFRVCCAVCGRPLLLNAIASSLRSGHFPWSQKSRNSTDSHTRPVSQVGHHVELPQLCSFCACASNHVTVNTRAFCRTYQQHLKYQRARGLIAWLVNCYPRAYCCC
jgi:hypothetical protein